MNGFEQFMETFGGVTLGTVAVIVISIIFIYRGYKKFSKYLLEKHDAEQRHLAELTEALEGVRKYPEYREQSHKIQVALQSDIKAINVKYETLAKDFKTLTDKFEDMEERARKKDLSLLKDKIIERYKYYTDPEINPTQTWNKMEAESFWELFNEYEARGGNGYLHSDVQPKMMALKEIDIGQPLF